MEIVQVLIELPRDVFSARKQDPEGFVHEMRAAAAVTWHENSVIQQGKAAAVLGDRWTARSAREPAAGEK